MTKYIKLIISGIATLFVYSCTETIDIDFNEFDTQYVIEANLSNLSAPLVTVSTTINFDEPNIFPPISGALITLTDEQGNAIVLDEVLAGSYTNPDFRGQSGQTYTLDVNINGETFQSVCKVPEQVLMDSISLEKIEASMWTTVDAASVYNVYVHFQDPPNVDNYYFFIEYINGEQVRSFPDSDFGSDGRYLNRELHTHDRSLNKGDTLTVEMRCISEDVHTYLTDINENNPMLATPTNPKNNIQNATLGYFSAHTSQIKTMIIPY